jgi:hypothetical protein
MSSDIKQMMTLADEKSGMSTPLQFQSSEFDYITDDNSSYSEGGFITYDLTSMQNKWVNLAQSYLALPINALNAGYTTGNEILALKQSALSLISGSQLTTTTGETVYNQPQYLDIYSNTKLLCDSTPESAEALRGILVFAKDEGSDFYVPLTAASTATTEFTSTSASVFTYDLVTPANSTVATTTTTTRATFNAGMKYRDAKTSVNWDTVTSFRFLAYIPLRYLHPVFEKLDFPILGCTMKLQVTLNTGARSFISSALPAISIQSLSLGSARTRLYCNVVKLPPAIEAEELKKLSQGITRIIKYTDFDLYTAASKSSTSVSELVTTGVVKPTRVLFCGVEEKKVLTPAATDYKVPVNYLSKFTNVNLLINGTPFFRNNLTTLPQMYQEFLRACGNADNNDSKLQKKAYISYDDFENLYRINAFNISEVKAMLSSETQPVRIEVIGTRDAGTHDYICFIEKEKILRLTLNGLFASVLSTQ